MLSPLPRRSGWAYSSLCFTQPYQPSPKGLSGRPAHCPFRGLLSVHSRYGLHTRAATNSCMLIEGFSHFVTSMTAPIASGWSGCRVGLREIVRGAIMQHTSAKRIKANEKAEELIRVRLSMIADDIEGKG
jgi:hypothetical protein